MAGPRLQEFRISLDDADLRRCEEAGIAPGELVTSTVRAAIAALAAPIAPVAAEESAGSESDDAVAGGVEEESAGGES